MDDGADEASVEPDDSLLAGSAAGVAAVPAAGAALPPLLPPRKSVTYQPDPFSWKPAAVTCLENVSAEQAGQDVGGAEKQQRQPRRPLGSALGDEGGVR